MKLSLLVAVCAALAVAAAPQSPPSLQWATVPPAPWAQADPADSLYRSARRALDDKNYDRAAQLFESIVSRYPGSTYAPDALYWKGFALYRDGNLDGAATSLEAQAKRYPRAATRGDASTLLIVVKGEMAKRGDASARRDVANAASGAGEGAGKACEDMEVQIAALDALQQMDAERVWPLLRKVLARRDECSVPLRKNALFIVGQRAGPDREKLLLDLAKSDPSPGVRQDAVFYLSQAKSDASVDALEDLLFHSDENGVRQNALFALAQIGTNRARDIIRKLVLSNDAPTSLRNDAVFHVAQRQDAEDVAWLRDAYARIDNQKLRDDVMFQIASRSSPETSKWLASVVRDPKETMEQRKNALFHLASRKNGASDELVPLYDNGLSTEMKKELLFHIASRMDEKALLKLISIAKTDSNQELRKEALVHLAQSKDPRALKALEEIVTP